MGGEVLTDIINVSVAIIINAVAGNLDWVDPHVGCQVGVAGLDASICTASHSTTAQQGH
jgi:hypothetical protein